MDIDNENGTKFQFGNPENTFHFYYKNFTSNSFIEPDNFDLAINFYQKALSLNKNKENKAQILFQMASVEQGKYYQFEDADRKTISYEDKEYDAKSITEQARLDNIKNTKFRGVFAVLKKYYSDTKTGKDLKSSCLYFQYYMNR